MTYSESRFSMFKKFVSGSVFLEVPIHADSIEFSNFLLQLKNQRSASKTVRIYYLYFESNYDVLKSKNACFLLNKNINFSKNEKESKMENPTQGFREMNIVLQLV